MRCEPVSRQLRRHVEQGRLSQTGQRRAKQEHGIPPTGFSFIRKEDAREPEQAADGHQRASQEDCAAQTYRRT